ncbi:MAG: 6-oxocyclohex-1-ene-1-carbonyl-CoA hydratase, partial [Desulfuromonadales bacterium]
GRDRIKDGGIDLSMLDEKVEELCARLIETFPECMTKSLEELRKPKLQAWNNSKENSRAWLALNMMNEARTGFRAFNEGDKETGREIDFVKLRQGLARGVPWTEELIDSLMPGKEA